jgi:hypothetical protein
VLKWSHSKEKFAAKVAKSIFFIRVILPNSDQFFKDESPIFLTNIKSGAPSSKDPKFEQRPPGALWLTFHKSNYEKLFLISNLKAVESLETFRSGLVGQSFITRNTG